MKEMTVEKAAVKKPPQKAKVTVEFTDGYEQRFTAAVLKIYERRLKRKIEKQLNTCVGVGTKSQQALKLQREANKIVSKRKTREQIEVEKQRKFELRQQKKKDKHKGK